jgi:hypothetical protein
MSYPNLGIIKKKIHGFVQQLVVEKDGTKDQRKLKSLFNLVHSIGQSCLSISKMQ